MDGNLVAGAAAPCCAEPGDLCVAMRMAGRPADARLCLLSDCGADDLSTPGHVRCSPASGIAIPGFVVIEERIFVAAPASQVWGIVADPVSMADLSPEVSRVEWVRDAGPRRGATFCGHNRVGPVRWATDNVIDVAEQDRAFSWRAIEGNGRCVSRWTYRIEERSGGCETVERYEPVGWMATAEYLLGCAWMLRRGMRATLANLKVAAERAALS
jgi:hypothetical protein